jgi:hypothetical protein
LRETVQVGEKLPIHEVAQVVAGHGFVVVEFAVLPLGCSPAFPAIGFVEDEGVFVPLEPGLHSLVLLEAVEVFQEEEPRGLLGVVQFGGAASLFPEHVVDVLEGLLEHGSVLYPGLNRIVGCGDTLTHPTRPGHGLRHRVQPLPRSRAGGNVAT